MKEDMTGYENLAYAIVARACADYVNALVVLNGGYPPDYEAANLKKLWRAVLNYGEKRFIVFDKKTGKISRQKEKNNKKTCTRIMNLIHRTTLIENARKDKIECERFFRSGAFDIYMPSINGEDLIKALRKKAESGEWVLSVNI